MHNPKGIRSFREIALTSVVSKWYATCQKEKKLEGWDGIGCGLFQVTMTQLLHKHWVRKTGGKTSGKAARKTRCTSPSLVERCKHQQKERCVLGG